MGGAVKSLFGGGDNGAKKAAEESRRRQLAEMARQAAETDQQRVAGVNPRRGRLLTFAQEDKLGTSA